MLILDEPTRGIDVAAKQELMNEVMRLARDGMAVLFISSEIDEVLRISDRVVVLRDRRKAGELPRGASEAEVMEPDLRAGRHDRRHDMSPPARRLPCRKPPRPRDSPGCAPSRHPLAVAAGDARADPRRQREPEPRACWHLQWRDGHLYGSLVDIVNRAAPLAIVALGMTLVIATRGIDISVGAVVAISGAVAALMIGGAARDRRRPARARQPRADGARAARRAGRGRALRRVERPAGRARSACSPSSRR